MGFRRNRILFIIICISSCFVSLAQTVRDTNAASRARLTAANSAVETFQIKRGFRIELAAAEPLVLDPVAIAFDENGRLFVVEMRDYPNRRNDNPHPGRVRLLEDTDGDGTFDTATVYADNLPLPSAIACYGGGVYVCAMPDILYLKDTNGDGAADVRRPVISGLGSATDNSNRLAFVNNFNWGLDNRIHAATAGSGGTATAPNGSVSIAGRDFGFDPRTLTVTAENGDGHSGLTFDDSGRRFTCSATEPAQLSLLEWRYAARNPFFAMPAGVIDLARIPMQVFPFVSETPVATNRAVLARINTAARAAADSVQRAPRFFRMASGCAIYRGTATNYVGDLFVPDPAANLIQHLVVRENGLAALVQRSPDEQGTDFLVSRDTWFRPMQIVNGPDGGLYVADFSRESIVTPDASDAHRSRAEARAGGERGRIWRIVPENFQRPPAPRMSKATTYELVATLAHPNGWHRDTAARLLYERQDKAAISLLTNMVNNSRLPLARLHALHALDGLNALNEAVVAKGLRDSDQHVREHAVLLSEKLARNGTVSDSLWIQLTSVTGDTCLRVRYQLALTLGEIQHAGRPRVIAEILRRDIGPDWIRAAVLSSLAQGGGELFGILAADARFRNVDAGQQFLRELTVMIGTQNRSEEIAQVLDFIDRANLEARLAYAFLGDLGEGLARAGSSLAAFDSRGRLARFYAGALNATLASGATQPLRVEATRLLGCSAYTTNDVGDLILLLLDPSEAEVVRQAGIATLARAKDSRVIPSILQRWSVLTPESKREALVHLLARAEHTAALVTAIEAGRIPVADLSSTEINFLRTHPNPIIAGRAAQIFGRAEPPRREIVDQFARALKPAGSAVRGRQLFQNRCGSCHEIAGANQKLGPDLAKARSGGREKLLVDILDPSREVLLSFATYVLETNSGETLVGVLDDPNGINAVLRQPNGRSIVAPRNQIAALTSRPWSLMPTDAAEGLTVQEVADLIEYVMTGR